MRFSQYLSTMIIKSIFFQFTYMPNGYELAMRIFTKISKVYFGHLRSQGHNSVAYVTNSYLQGDTYQSCLTNILDIAKFIERTGLCCPLR